ncbi:MAG: Ldh family oxidoreductase [Proteobacteria bacterium]|nr:Ldh family oxidoreductase [Pseudomonadota bacterium]
MKIAITELQGLIEQALIGHGMVPANAPLVAATIVAAERDGSRSHGLQRLPGYLSSLKSGWVDGKAEPVIEEAAPSLLKVDARNGFAQVALARASLRLRAMVERQGTASLATRDSHHFAALWPDVEPFAADGYIVLSMIHSRARIVTWGGTKRVLGTNPMAFGCPRKGKPPVVWDQASSTMSQGDVLLASSAKRQLLPGIGVDAEGRATTDPDAVLQGGALLPFANAKGGSIAFMIEILSAALTGARFGFEDTSAGIKGALTSNAGQFMLLIDPKRIGGDGFVDRVELLVQHLLAAGTERMPGDHRYARRALAERDGVEISDGDYSSLKQGQR